MAYLYKPYFAMVRFWFGCYI